VIFLSKAASLVDNHTITAIIAAPRSSLASRRFIANCFSSTMPR